MLSREDFGINLKEVFFYFLGKRLHFKVEGESMLPFLKEGDRVLIEPGRPQLGNVVVAKENLAPGHERLLIKTLSKIEGEKAHLKSLNPKGRNLSVPIESLIGELKVVF